MPTYDWILNEKYVKTRIKNENISKDMGEVEFEETILIYFIVFIMDRDKKKIKEKWSSWARNIFKERKGKGTYTNI